MTNAIKKGTNEIAQFIVKLSCDFAGLFNKNFQFIYDRQTCTRLQANDDHKQRANMIKELTDIKEGNGCLPGFSTAEIQDFINEAATV